MTQGICGANKCICMPQVILSTFCEISLSPNRNKTITQREYRLVRRLHSTQVQAVCTPVSKRCLYERVYLCLFLQFSSGGALLVAPLPLQAWERASKMWHLTSDMCNSPSGHLLKIHLFTMPIDCLDLCDFCDTTSIV